MEFYWLVLWIVTLGCVPGQTSPILTSNAITNGNGTSLNESIYSAAFFRPTWIAVHLDSIQSNVREIKKYIGNAVNLLAVVKADAYGFGAVEVAEIAITAGANWLGVATLDEALLLRNRLEQFVPILVLGYVDPQHLSVVSRHRITVSAVSLEWIQEANKIARQPFDFHLKLDTGMNRLGCKTFDEVRSITQIVSHNPYLNWTGAFTHFASADDVEDTFYYYEQLELFYKFLSFVPLIENKIIHCANSGATLLQSNKPFFNMVRTGRALYGSINANLIPITLQRASIQLYSTLVQVKQLEVGERVGYGGTYTTTQRQWIGTVPTGYGEGWHVRFSSNFALVDGQRVRIIGRVSMDQMTVALPEKYPVGTLVTFIAKAANETERPSYELFPTATERLARVYYLDGSVVSIRNPILESINLI